MFGLVASVPVARPLVPTIAPAEVPDGEYRQLASRLGVNVPEVKEDPEKLEALLSKMGLRVYDFKEVKRFLDRQYGWKPLLRGTPWGYRGLRVNDLPKNGHYVALWRRRHNGSFLGGQDTAPYNKPIPYPVLQTIDRISQKLPTAKFYISDEAVRQPVMKDPFLMVSYGGVSCIIERWDEPGFRPRR